MSIFMDNVKGQLFIKKKFVEFHHEMMKLFFGVLSIISLFTVYAQILALPYI